MDSEYSFEEFYDSNPLIRAWVVCNTRNLSVDKQLIACMDPSLVVRKELAGRCDLDPSVYEILSQDPDGEVISVLARSIEARKRLSDIFVLGF